MMKNPLLLDATARSYEQEPPPRLPRSGYSLSALPPEIQETLVCSLQGSVPDEKALKLVNRLFYHIGRKAYFACPLTGLLSSLCKALEKGDSLALTYLLNHPGIGAFTPKRQLLYAFIAHGNGEQLKKLLTILSPTVNNDFILLGLSYAIDRSNLTATHALLSLEGFKAEGYGGPYLFRSCLKGSMSITHALLADGRFDPCWEGAKSYYYALQQGSLALYRLLKGDSRVQQWLQAHTPSQGLWHSFYIEHIKTFAKKSFQRIQ